MSALETPAARYLASFLLRRPCCGDGAVPIAATACGERGVRRLLERGGPLYALDREPGRSVVGALQAAAG